MISSVEVGSILTRVYYQVPDWTGNGESFDDYAEAIAHARLRKDLLWEDGRVNPRVHIDTRWVMRHPATGTTVDVTAERVEFAPSEVWADWEATRACDLLTVAIELGLYDRSATSSWVERKLLTTAAPVRNAARVDPDGSVHPVEVVHRESSWRVITRDRPGVFERVVAAVEANLPADPDARATIVVRLVGSQIEPWTWKAGDRARSRP